MRKLITAVAIGLLIATCKPALSATQQDYDDCNQTSDLNHTMSGCTHVIEDQAAVVADRVTAYLQRGNMYEATGKSDAAIADYSEAIKLDPQNVLAYCSRAIAYLRKRDHDHAIADYNEANTLDPTKTAEMTAANAELKDIGALPRQSLEGAGAEASAKFGGAPYCRYRVSMRNLVLKALVGENGNIITASLTGTMVETTVGGCPYPPLGSLSHTYAGTGSLDGQKISLELAPAQTNSPHASAQFSGQVENGRLNGKLTIRRNDVTNNLGWTVVSTVK